MQPADVAVQESYERPTHQKTNDQATEAFRAKSREGVLEIALAPAPRCETSPGGLPLRYRGGTLGEPLSVVGVRDLFSSLAPKWRLHQFLQRKWV